MRNGTNVIVTVALGVLLALGGPAWAVPTAVPFTSWLLLAPSATASGDHMR